MSVLVAFGVLAFVTIAYFSNVAFVYAEEDLLSMSLRVSQEKSEYIQENLEKVGEHYNQSSNAEETGPFTATSVEFTKPVYLTDKNEYAVYMDFNDDCGYLLVDKDNILYEFSVTGDNAELQCIDEIYYNEFDGFLYFDNETQTYQRIEQSLEQQLDMQGEYNGQDGNGDGKIYNIEEYVSNRYGNYSRDYSDWYVLDEFVFHNQYDTSVYVQQKSNGLYSEGNCVLNATYSMMCDWQSKKILRNLPTNKVDYSTRVKNDKLYSPFGDGTYSNWRTNSNYYLSNMPQLYLDIRAYAIDYGYKNESFYFSDVIKLAQNTATKYGYSITMKQSSSFGDAKGSLRSGKALLIGVNNSATYGNHGMTVIGYIKYTYKSGWWIFSSTKTAYFFAVDDCHGNADENKFVNRLHTSADTLTEKSYRAVWYDPNAGASNTYVYYA